MDEREGSHGMENMGDELFGAVGESEKTKKIDANFWFERINVLFDDISSIEESNLKKTVADMLASKILGSHSGSFRPLKPLSGAVQLPEDSKHREKFGGCSSGSSISSDEDQQIKQKRRNEKKHTVEKYRLVYPPIKILKPMPFSLREDRALDDFLREFEEYAVQNCGSDKRKWLMELSSLFKGSALRSFETINSGRVPYERVIERMKRWYDERIKDKREDGHARFARAKMRTGESSYGFALRLESLAENLRLINEDEKRSFLLEKFMEEVPRALRKRIKERINYHHLIRKDEKET